MTFVQLQNRVYSLLRDPLKTKYRLQDVKDAINDTERTFCIKTENTVENTKTITTSSGQREYQLPSDYGIFKGAFLDNDELLNIDIADTMTSTRGTGEPDYFYIRNNRIGFEPEPDGDYTLQLYYYSIGGGMKLDTDTPVFPLEHVQTIIYGAAYPLALSSDDERSNQFWQLFQNGIQEAITESVKKSMPHGFPKIGRRRIRGLDPRVQDIYGIT